MLRTVVAVHLMLLPGQVFAGDDFAEIVDAMEVGETRFDVVPRAEAEQAPPATDDPVRLPLAIDNAHRDEGRPFLDPFVGREVYPEISARIATGFFRKKYANSGEPGGSDGTMALDARVDLSLWFIDLRFPLDSSRRDGGDPFELVLKAPIAITTHHRIAPMLVVHVPINDGFGSAVVEAGVGYHYARSGVGLKLEISAFDGAPDRTTSGSTGGTLGWNAALSYLISDHIGVLVEADGTTAISERKAFTPPAVGDTIVRLMPGARFFLGESGATELGLAALFTIVPDGYGLQRDQGVLVDFGYTFF